MEDHTKKFDLSALVGKEVIAHKGGSEDSTGRLLDVKQDYITISDEKEGTIYYQTKHVKAIVEDTKSTIKQDTEQTLSEQPTSSSFQELLGSLVDKTVKINRKGPESQTGTLLAVSHDYLVLDADKNGVIYYTLGHIQSVNTKEENTNTGKNEAGTPDENNKKNEDHSEGDQANKQKEKPHFLKAEGLAQLYNTLNLCSVRINNGPDRVEGVLVDAKDNQLTIVVNDEVFRMSQSHVKSIRQKIKNVNNSQEQSNYNNNNQNESSSIVSAKKKQQDRKKKR